MNRIIPFDVFPQRQRRQERPEVVFKGMGSGLVIWTIRFGALPFVHMTKPDPNASRYVYNLAGQWKTLRGLAG